MPIEVFLMVLGAALVHATWNALVKTDGDRLSLIKLMSATQIFVSLVFIPFVSVPSLASLALSGGKLGVQHRLHAHAQSGLWSR